MIRKDYIMRLIEQFSSALMKIILHKETKEYTQALFEIDTAYKTLLGFDPEFVKAVPEDELVGMMTSGGSIDSNKCIILAELLREEAEIKELENRENDIILSLYIKSFYIFSEALLSDDRYRQQEYLEKIDKITGKIILYPLPDRIRFSLFCYYEHTGRFGKAEDMLYELIAVDYPDILAAGRSFYTRLLGKSDRELANGNLPRNEVREGLAQLEKRSPS